MPCWIFLTAALGCLFLLLAWRCETAGRAGAAPRIRWVRRATAISRFAVEAHSLNSQAILRELAGCVRGELQATRLYICLREGGEYVIAYCAEGALNKGAVVCTVDSALARLGPQDTGLVVRQLAASQLYKETAQGERWLLKQMGVSCVAALRGGNESVGLLLLGEKKNGRGYRGRDVRFLEALCPIAGLALKNALQYEKLFREARIDALTGVLNYGSFTEAVTEQYARCGEECLSLLFVDMDDFKLYNQLYGVEAGDAALRTSADIVRSVVGCRGTVYRTSGKVFALLLPGWDELQARDIAKEIHSGIAAAGKGLGLGGTKNLTASIGICTAPWNASSAKELMDNADLATYNAKKSGKDRTLVFRKSVRELRHMTEKTLAIVEQVERGESEYRSAMAMISALTAAIDAKDHYTYAHSENVAFYAANLAVGAGLNDDQVRMIYAAGLLHDIGKISIPENILNKQGGLNQEEFGIMKDHVNGAIEMIRHLPDMDYLIPAALGHHERWDGRGYPRGIGGNEIPVSARCLSVADGFDAMITDRPYRKGLPVEYALNQIENGAGSQFDPDLAILFVNLVRAREIPVRDRVAC